MKRYPLVRATFIFLFCCTFITSCAAPPDDLLHHPPESAKDTYTQGLTVEMPDSSCSYFYLLLGNHAENNNLYEEAEEAFEKALICDPDSKYILRRLPVLLLRMGKTDEAKAWLQKGITQFPEDTIDRLFLARLAIREDNIDLAIDLYRQVLAITPEDDTLLLRIGFLQSQQERFTEAEETFLQALELNPDTLFTHLYLARLYNSSEAYDKAKIYYEKALLLNWSVELALEVADFYTMLKDFQAVEQLYRSIHTSAPEDLRGGLGLVNILLMQDKEQQAFETLNKLRESSTDTATIDLVAARLYLRANNMDQAAAILTPLAIEDRDEEALYMLGVIHYQQKDIQRAMTLLQMIEPSGNFYEDGLSLQVRIYMEKKQFTKAITLLKGAIASNKQSSPELYTLLASLYMEQGLFQDSYTILDTALGVHPNSTKVYFEYGLLLEKENKREQALKQMSALLEIDPDHAEALNYVGYTWADMGINLEQALAYIQKAIALKPGNGYIRDSLGWVYFRMGELSRATEEILKAIKLEPNDPYIHEHLGDIYLKLGKREQALKAYKEAQRLFTDINKQQQMQERIDGL